MAIQDVMKRIFTRVSAKNLVIILGLVPSVVGFFEIYDRMESYSKKPYFMVNRVSAAGHFLTYNASDLIGGSRRNQFGVEKVFKSPSAQVSITIVNPTKDELIAKGFSLYVETRKANEGFLFPSYFVLSEMDNPSQRFSSTVLIKPQSSLDVEFDVITIDDRDKVFSEGLSRVAVSFYDQDFERYSQEMPLREGKVFFSQQVVFPPKLTDPVPENIHLYGQDYGYNPFRKDKNQNQQ